MHFKWFDRFILTLIFLNSLILAFTDYSVVDATGEPVPRVGGVSSFGNDLVDKTELFFTTCFTFECGVKIIGLGLFAGQSTYLRSGWNKLDFVVVIAG